MKWAALVVLVAVRLWCRRQRARFGYRDTNSDSARRRLEALMPREDR